MTQNCAKISGNDDAPRRGESFSDIDAEIAEARRQFESHLKGAYKQYERLKKLQEIRQTRTGASFEEK